MAFGIFSINIKRHLRRGLSCFFFHIFVLILIVGIRNLFLIRPAAEKGRSFSAVLMLSIYEESIRISILRLTLCFLLSLSNRHTTNLKG